jgi:hypothetical protein
MKKFVANMLRQMADRIEPSEITLNPMITFHGSPLNPTEINRIIEKTMRRA